MAEYNDKFRKTILKARNLDGLSQIEQYIKGLRPQIGRDVLLRRPLSLNEAMLMASTAEATDRIYHLPQQTPQRISCLLAPKSRGYQQPRLKKLTPTEKEHLMSIGACFRRRKTGHLGKLCPMFQQRRINNVEVTTDSDNESGKIQRHLFYEELPDKNPITTRCHRIRLVEGTHPTNRPPYRLSAKEMEEVNRQTTKLLQKA